MEAELYNLYVDKLLNEVVELTKTKLVLAARLEHQQKITDAFKLRIDELEATLDKVKIKPATLKVKQSDDF